MYLIPVIFIPGFQLYAMLVEVFEPERARARWYYAAAYVAPLVIVVVSGVVDFASYGTERHCWLRADNYFILAFVVPVALVLLVSDISSLVLPSLLRNVNPIPLSLVNQPSTLHGSTEKSCRHRCSGQFLCFFLQHHIMRVSTHFLSLALCVHHCLDNCINCVLSVYLFIFQANWVCLCMVIYMMCHHSNVSIKTKENNKLYKIK